MTHPISRLHLALAGEKKSDDGAKLAPQIDALSRVRDKLKAKLDELTQAKSKPQAGSIAQLSITVRALRRLVMNERD